MLNTRKLALFIAAAATALALSGCTGGMSGMDMGDSETPNTSETAAAKFNSADVTFAQMMIPHHEQAVAMSDMLLAKDGIDERVDELATQIKAAQQPEIDQLKQWLSDWGQEPEMAGMENGMMSEDDMTALEDATGADAARLFLEQMVVHHQGAMDMAESEVQDGKDPDAKALAETIVETQTDEVTTMQELLASL